MAAKTIDTIFVNDFRFFYHGLHLNSFNRTTIYTEHTGITNFLINDRFGPDKFSQEFYQKTRDNKIIPIGWFEKFFRFCRPDSDNFPYYRAEFFFSLF